MRASFILASLFAAAKVLSHPGADHAAEAAERAEYFKQHQVKRDLSHCAGKLDARGHTKRAIVRRQELYRSLQLAHGLENRAPSDINKSHHSDQDYDLHTPPELLFGTNNSCILSPEVILGPYYVAGEFVRKDITDDQRGVPLYLDTQVIDINTCDPVARTYIEIWHANATGVYSGVVAEGNGVESDQANLNRTYLRGIQPTDPDGISTFKSIWPGHYAGRTTHIHVIAHINATMLPNGTIMNTVASHVGQMYFDQSLIYEVEKYSPYTDNTQSLTLNAEDDILAQGAETSDPLMTWVYLGKEAKDGILAWLNFGIDTTIVSNLSAASFYYKDGGVTNPNPEPIVPPS
ncbi:unnamed protein product [Clonostachys rosea]|uniref:Intradiol ring-cleavage dioxygenases domain-containing protein n=1 Tax=Bionectria ochroleuca TaxID=29856 RepID=A0ABY6UMT9_BIOOC|nr:unnamed protein product [Clonostachys rosea]